MPYTSPLDVFLLFVRDSRILLALRENTGFADGLWNVPSGKLEEGEDLLTAAVREAREEVAVEVHSARLATVVHVLRDHQPARVGFFFEALSWSGEPANAEPHKCGGLRWCPPGELPANTVPYTSAGVAQYLRGDSYGRLDW